MTDQGPQNTVQLAGHAASDIISGLKQSPVLLALVVLNVVICVVGYFFLKNVGDQIAARDQRYIGLLERCIIETSPLRGPDSHYYPGSTHKQDGGAQ